MRRFERQGLSLVELLVVIAIIGILVALLLPAIQAAREAARRAECANNVKQLALACLLHEEQHGFFPSGGWGYLWVGDSYLGYGANQPGSWLFNILPFVENADVRDYGRNLAGGDRLRAVAQQNQVVIPFFYCPTRRLPRTRPITFTPYNSSPMPLIVRADYSANCGDFGSALMSPPEGPSPTVAPRFNWDNAQRGLTGVSYVKSEISAAAITDGLSKTLLIGEENLNPQHYDSGVPLNDNQGAYTGFNYDNNRVVSRQFPPGPDTPGQDRLAAFGSAHVSGWHVALCDGSVNFLDYDIDIVTASRLANRKDGGQPIR
jgi:prepilin-type N-terminal cleavage/methylation domain-containing protein